MIERRAQRKGEQRRALYCCDCLDYRYLLEIAWLPERGFMQWLMLNPSKATELEDDPTIRRCKQFAADWGFGGIWITNIAAWRATDPRNLISQSDPIGAGNTPEFLSSLGAGLVVAGWGNWGARAHLQRQVEEIRTTMGGRLHALGLTQEWQPRHPLYIRGDTKPRTLVELEEPRRR
jgi:hypothetical protein